MVTPEQIDKAQREAVHPAAAPAAELLERLAEKLGGRLTQSAVYGEPIECDGVTIITVAGVSWGFGGAARVSAPRIARTLRRLIRRETMIT